MAARTAFIQVQCGNGFKTQPDKMKRNRESPIDSNTSNEEKAAIKGAQCAADLWKPNGRVPQNRETLGLRCRLNFSLPQWSGCRFVAIRKWPDLRASRGGRCAAWRGFRG
jgi:hypothetical protein